MKKGLWSLIIALLVTYQVMPAAREEVLSANDPLVTALQRNAGFQIFVRKLDAILDSNPTEEEKKALLTSPDLISNARSFIKNFARENPSFIYLNEDQLKNLFRYANQNVANWFDYIERDSGTKRVVFIMYSVLPAY